MTTTIGTGDDDNDIDGDGAMGNYGDNDDGNNYCDDDDNGNGDDTMGCGATVYNDNGDQNGRRRQQR